MTRTVRPVLLGMAWSVALLVLVYGPTFALVAFRRAKLETAIPMIILLSLSIALALVAIAARVTKTSIRDFGFQSARKQYIFAALGLGTPLALVLTWLDLRFGSPGPLSGLRLPYWEALLLFGLCAPVQEEIIFRGLIQTMVKRSVATEWFVGRTSVSVAALITAILFGAIHFEVAIFTAVAALILGVLAGELRSRSHSVLPSIAAHMIFNLASFFWIALR